MKPDLEKARLEYASLSTPALRNLIQTAHTLPPECLLPLRQEAEKRKIHHEVQMLDGLLDAYRAKGSPDFFENIDARDVQRVVQMLKERLPKKATEKNVQLTPAMLEATLAEGETLQAALQRIADRMCAHLMLRRPIKIMTMAAIPAGKYQLIEGLSCILVNDDLVNQNFLQKVAILAHELSHYYLIFEHNIVHAVETENEFLTEINAVYIGFGLLLLQGYQGHQRQVGERLQTTRVGYVSLEIVYEAIIATAYARKQKPQWLLRKLPFWHAVVAIPRLWRLYMDYRKRKRARQTA